MNVVTVILIMVIVAAVIAGVAVGIEGYLEIARGTGNQHLKLLNDIRALVLSAHIWLAYILLKVRR